MNKMIKIIIKKICEIKKLFEKKKNHIKIARARIDMNVSCTGHNQ